MWAMLNGQRKIYCTTPVAPGLIYHRRDSEPVIHGFVMGLFYSENQIGLDHAICPFSCVTRR